MFNCVLFRLEPRSQIGQKLLNSFLGCRFMFVPQISYFIYEWKEYGCSLSEVVVKTLLFIRFGRIMSNLRGWVYVLIIVAEIFSWADSFVGLIVVGDSLFWEERVVLMQFGSRCIESVVVAKLYHQFRAMQNLIIVV